MSQASIEVSHMDIYMNSSGEIAMKMACIGLLFQSHLPNSSLVKVDIFLGLSTLSTQGIVQTFFTLTQTFENPFIQEFQQSFHLNL